MSRERQQGCQPYREQIDAYLDGELTAHEAARLQAHIDTCGGCRSQLHETVALWDLVLDQLPPAPAGRELVGPVLRALRGKREPAVVVPLRDRVKGWAAVCAALLLVALMTLLLRTPETKPDTAGLYQTEVTLPPDVSPEDYEIAAKLELLSDLELLLELDDPVALDILETLRELDEEVF